jgi:hypothetical protein
VSRVETSILQIQNLVTNQSNSEFRLVDRGRLQSAAQARNHYSVLLVSSELSPRFVCSAFGTIANAHSELRKRKAQGMCRLAKEVVIGLY